MSDSWQIPFLFGSNVTGWALACAYMLKARKWEISYRGALRQYEGLLSAAKAPTPHQKAAETKRRKRIDEMRAKRLAMEADISRRKIMAGVTLRPALKEVVVSVERSDGSWFTVWPDARGRFDVPTSGPDGDHLASGRVTIAADEMEPPSTERLAGIGRSGL
jgi:hypothetical protein